ncbi:MAG: class I SAM-dependent RNA methyltransferase [Deltaproteobacteria bacterium]|nr:class I SAM-dependent RNA methyltransferase [Deltaproteobacteria bacterium]
MYSYEMTNRYFAQIADGMEELGRDELSALGAQDVKEAFRGLYFSADKQTLYRINYLTRLCTRVLAPLITFDCHSTKYLYKTASSIDWPALFDLNQTFCISANVANSKITHSQYAGLCLKDAIVDCFRDRFGKRPDVQRIEPDIQFNLHINNNLATIYFDTSGGSLHRRGYRRQAMEAPMQESLAAAIIRLTLWDGQNPLYDPMCGSGTLLCEAAMLYCRIPAGYLRRNYGFTHLPDFELNLWQSVKREADAHMRNLPPGLIAGSDINPQALAMARDNAGNLPGGRGVRMSKKRFQDLPALENTTIVCNPPYGKRIGRQDDLGLLMKEFGDFLKQRCKGSQAFVYFGKRELIKSVGLRTTWKKSLKNGPLDGRLVKYELY